MSYDDLLRIDLVNNTSFPVRHTQIKLIPPYRIIFNLCLGKISFTVNFVVQLIVITLSPLHNLQNFH